MRRKIRVEFFPPLPFDDLGNSQRDQMMAAMRLSVATECLIRRYPVQWTHWTSLTHRWREALPVWNRWTKDCSDSLPAES